MADVITGSDFGPDPSSKYAFEKAEKEGLKIILPAANELFIDIDNDRDFDVFSSHFGLLYRYYGKDEVTYETTPSRSGSKGRQHITVKLKEPIGSFERILLQAVLGSDRKREFLSFLEWKQGDLNPTLFLEKNG